MRRKAIKVDKSEFPILDGLKLYASATTGDGNCLFRAMSDQIHGDETEHGEIRQSVVKFVEQNADHFSAFVGEFGESFGEYMSRMAQDGVYGGHIEIVGFASVYNRQVVIYQADSLYVVQPQCFDGTVVDKNTKAKPVHLAYHSWEHYSSVRQVGGPRSGPVEFDIPGDSTLGSIELNDSSQDTSEVPSWKVDIVMKSVPDAKEDKVIRMLREKDYDQVIEELIMCEFGELPEEVDPASQAPSTDAVDPETKATSPAPKEDEKLDKTVDRVVNPSPNTNRGPKKRDTTEVEAQPEAGVADGAANINRAQTMPVNTKKDRKRASKQKRQEKKERVRSKHMRAASESTGTEPDPTHKLKVVHI